EQHAREEEAHPAIVLSILEAGKELDQIADLALRKLLHEVLRHGRKADLARLDVLLWNLLPGAVREDQCHFGLGLELDAAAFDGFRLEQEHDLREARRNFLVGHDERLEEILPRLVAAHGVEDRAHLSALPLHLVALLAADFGLLPEDPAPVFGVASFHG